MSHDVETPEGYISLEDAEEQVARVCRRLGLLHLAFAQVLVDDLGREEGGRVVARAIKEYGRLIGDAKREQAEKAGLEPGPESFRQVSDLPTLGMHDGIEEVEVEGETRIRAYGCVMGKVWNELGKSELGRYYCLVDPASSMIFDPRHKLVHTRALPDGDPYCELVMRPTTEGDRVELAADDTDWSMIEGE
jgi:hypothetical protein